MTAGTALLMWFGELITQRGIGNGMSLIITASIVSQFPAQFSALQQNEGYDAVAAFAVILFLALFGIVFVEQGQRRIPVQFAKRVVGRKQYGGQSTYIPLKVNQSGVIPIIFASSILLLPVIMSNVLGGSSPDGWRASVQSFVDEYIVNDGRLAASDAFVSGYDFMTDGAGGNGINFVFPRSVFVTSPGASRVLPGLHPGQPKHCGLEVMWSQHLPK